MIKQVAPKKVRDSRRKAGLCPRCGEKPERFKLHCSRCLKDLALSSRQYYKTHKKERRAKIRERVAYNKKHGLCVDCGHELVREMEPGVRCVNCTETVENCYRLNGG